MKHLTLILITLFSAMLATAQNPSPVINSRYGGDTLQLWNYGDSSKLVSTSPLILESDTVLLRGNTQVSFLVVNRDSFTDPAATIASVGQNGQIVQCFSCDTIQQLLDSTYNSPLTYNGAGQIVQRDTTLNVGIGTSSPTAKLHVDGNVLFDLEGNSSSIYHLIQSHDAAFDTLSFIQVDNSGITIELNATNGPSIGVNHKGIAITAGGGNVQLPGLGGADGYVFTSDANANGTWQDINTKIFTLPTYADDAAAGVGGLVQGQLYQTATGEVRIKL